MPMKSFLTFMQVFGFALISTFAFAQSKEISGTVKSADTGGPLPGATVVVEGTTNGTATDVNGKYTLKVNVGDVIVFSFIGMQDEKRTVGQANVYDVTLEAGVLMDEYVVTALGISREKKSLGYATQEISGEAISTIKSGNIVNQISGKAAGVKVRTNNNLGGSTDIVIRGYSSLTGSNQPLFVVDGVPLDNSNINSDAARGSTAGTGQTTGRKGFDYGNGIADINPADIASMTILKGGAATALYGSRAANGVVIITTKKGTDSGKKGIGVEINSSATVGLIDKSTFIDYQEEYGAGYVPGYSDEFPYFFSSDVNGDGIPDRVTPLTEDASYGARFDPNLMVYHYDAFVPETEYYGRARPWVYPENGPIEFFNNSLTLSNNFALTGANDLGGFRMSYTNTDISGIMPNASQVRNNFSMNASYNLSDKLKASGSANFINTRTIGRNSTGYSDNIVSMFRQWWQTNVDILRQKELFEQTGRNITWNPVDIGEEDTPIFWDNPYWSRYMNYQNDERNRFYGYLQLDYALTDKLSLNGMASVDTYTDLQEERRAIGSVPAEFGIGRPDVGSGYARFNRNYKSLEYRLMATYNTDLSESLNLNVLGGTSFRFDYLNTIYASTNGGLVVPELYSLGNSVNAPLASPEREESVAVYGYYANASLGISNTVFVDVSGRIDQSSTLPADNNTYFYPGVSASYIFTDVVDADWLNFAKLRLSWAQVGNDASFAQLQDVYAGAPAPFGSVPLYSVSSTKANAELKPEISTTIEGGLNFILVDRRLEFDLALYKTNTIDQVVPVAVSYATGNQFKVINAGEVLNQGVEIAAIGYPVKTDNFQWRVNVNWAKNNSEVIKLAEGLDNLQLGAFQGGVSINATEGQPYGTIQGTDYVYLNGERVVRQTVNEDGERMASYGAYAISPTTNNILGNIIPDWIGGITNTFMMGDFSVSFLVDFSMGGEIFSLDRYYGLATGLPEESVGTNDLGNPIRNTIDNGGGVILDGVTPEGEVNQARLDMSVFGGYGYRWNPAAGFVYDASWIKLREFSITYKLPASLIENSFLTAASVSLIGSNVWIIHKNLPDADPEATISSGNLQGWQSGILPTTRNFGLSVNLQF